MGEGEEKPKEKVREELQEHQEKVAKALNNPGTRALAEMGYYGVGVAKLAEDFDKAKKMAREAITGLMKARMTFHIIKVGGLDKERHLENMLGAEEYFIAAYKKTFGEAFETVE